MGRSCKNGGHQSRPQNTCLNAYLEPAVDFCLKCLRPPCDWGLFRALRDISVHQSWSDVHRQNQCSELSVGCSFAADLGLIGRRESARHICRN